MKRYLITWVEQKLSNKYFRYRYIRHRIIISANSMVEAEKQYYDKHKTPLSTIWGII